MTGFCNFIYQTFCIHAPFQESLIVFYSIIGSHVYWKSIASVYDFCEIKQSSEFCNTVHIEISFGMFGKVCVFLIFFRPGTHVVFVSVGIEIIIYIFASWVKMFDIIGNYIGT